MNGLSVELYLRKLQEKSMVVDFQTNTLDNTVIKGITYNSKEVKKNYIFICKGASFKESYLEEAIQRGAILYISETRYERNDIPYIQVSDIRVAMAIVGNLFYDSPSKKLNLIGITGTKGKSTTSYFTKAIIDDYMRASNKKESGMISTIETYDGKTREESHITTPESLQLQKHIANAVDSKIEFMQVEVSSQALKYHRVNEVEFEIGVFLNISEDHISPIEHRDFEDYFQSKLKIFDQSKVAVINADSEDFSRVLDAAKKTQRVVTYGRDTSCDLVVSNVINNGSNITFCVKCDAFEEEFVMTMKGTFNVENAVAAIAVAYVIGIPIEYIKSGIYRGHAKGRMECYQSNDQQIIAVVDYAHNKLSFQKLFAAIKSQYPEYKIVSIFGCPGGKAFNRRKKLGEIAGAYSDYIYLVADDPALEAVDDISKEIAVGVEEHNCAYEMLEHRGEAIRNAIRSVSEKTVLIVAGKGHETTQKYGNRLYSTRSDSAYVQQYIREYEMKRSINPIRMVEGYKIIRNLLGECNVQGNYPVVPHL